MTLKVYHVILHRTEDLDAFYADMETPGGYLHIPDRAVDYEARLPFSKVTAYRLTDEEAEEVRQDPRVRVVEPALEQHNIVAEPHWEQTSSYWRKDRSAASFTQRNWGLWQSTQSQSVTSSSGVPLSNFTSTATYADSGTVTLNAEGVNVDVVVVDGIPSLDHPEFAVNTDGSGGSRIIQYNWFPHTDSVTGGTYANGTWDYTTNSLGDSSNNNHGTHVMGTVAGNRQGWARKANLYSISPYSSNYNWSSTGISSTYVLDYVRAFHRNKAVNPETGRKNPTIINNSWGYNYGGIKKKPEELSNLNDSSFSYIEPVVNQALKRFKLKSDNWGLYGHGAGAHFVHRYVLYYPKSSYTLAIAANPGWYLTMTDKQWPFGLNNSDLSEEMLKKSLLDDNENMKSLYENLNKEVKEIL